MLTEFCSTYDLQIANTFTDLPADRLVTYREPGVAPLAPITSSTFAQLDLMLIPKSYASRIRFIESDRLQALSSQHFLVISSMEVSVPIIKHERTLRMDYQALRDPDFAKWFSQQVVSEFQQFPADYCDVDTFCQRLQNTLCNTATSNLPKSQIWAKRPWISENTLALIDRRYIIRSNGDWQQEKKLSRLIKNNVKHDREIWLQHLANTRESNRKIFVL